MELDDAVLYQDDPGAPDLMSERVSGLASSIYREFERLIGRYGQDVVTELMPLVVAVLENLDSVFSVNQEHQVELELLKEDNEQLVTQYEREKALRKHTEERYIVLEDSQDGEKKELQTRLLMLESSTRQTELKTRNYADQIGRLEEREAELKKEYNSLHQRHTEMIHSYMEHLERTKHQHTALVTQTEPSDPGHAPRTRKERPVSVGLFQLSGSDAVTPDLQRDILDPPSEPWRFNNLSHPRSNTSLKDEMSHLYRGGPEPGPKSAPGPGAASGAPGSRPNSARFPPDGSSSGTNSPSSARRDILQSPGAPRSRKDPAADRTGSTDSGPGVTRAHVHAPGSSGLTPPLSAAGVAMGASMDTASPSLEGGDPGQGFDRDPGRRGTEPGAEGAVVAPEDWQQAGQGHAEPRQGGSGQASPTHPGSMDAALTDEEDKLEKSAVQAIIESTPELDMDLGGFIDASTPTKVPDESLPSGRNTESLFEELSFAGNDLIGDVDDGADLLGMGREVEHLIQENTQLLETKHALNVVKNDLIAQVDELTCLKEGLQSELQAVAQAKVHLEEKNKELEDDLRKLREELQEVKQKTKGDDGEDQSDVPTAQRKRFTRVEMARVLMERNLYKERLMELQEAVRWAEMIRQSKENPALSEKKKSSIWQFFSRLFSSSGGAGKKPAAAAAGDAPPVHLRYNAPTAQVQPALRKKSSTLQQLPSDKSKAFDFLNEEAAADSVVSRREQRRAQYQQVKAHVQKEDGRVQANGWSLPHKYKVTNGGQSENKMRNLPIPVFLRPLDEKNTSMKLWCAAGVNLSGAKTRDGGSMVGASVFYSNAPGPEAPRVRKGSQSSLDKLDQELEAQQQEFRQQEDMSSLVWICTSTQASTRVVVIDANQPGNILDNFPVCGAYVLCIASVPGARETDYPAGEAVPLNPEAGPVGDDGSASVNASANSIGDGGEGLLGGITVVGCDAEGEGASPQTPGGTAGTDGEEDGRPADEALEASESSTGPSDRRKGPRGAYTEHVFADPLGAHKGDHPSGYSQRDGDRVRADGEAEADLTLEEAQKMSSVLPTMWLGAQNGCVYVHSSVAQWKKCLHWIKLKDSVQGIVHVKGRVLVGLSDGTLAIFHRGGDGQWDLTNYHLLDLGRPHHAVRCLTVVHDRVWCGSRNKIYVVQPHTMRVERSFDAHPRKESQVREMAQDGDGIWVSIRLDSTLRLFHAHTQQHLQDVDIEPYVSKMLGTGKLGFSFVRITALLVACNRLWIGTGNGVIMSVPLTETSEAHQALAPAGVGAGAGLQPGGGGGGVPCVYGDQASDRVTAATFVPYCSMTNAQLCFHGHRDAVKFFTAVPGHSHSSSEGGAPGGGADGSSQDDWRSMLVMSGGEGYIDFRMGDVAEEGEEPRLTLQPFQANAESSHLIVWQVLPPQNT